MEYSKLIPSLGSAVTTGVALYNYGHVVRGAASSVLPYLNVAAKYGGAIAAVPAGYFLGKAFYESSFKEKLEDYLWSTGRTDLEGAQKVAFLVREAVSATLVFGPVVSLAYLAYHDFV